MKQFKKNKIIKVFILFILTFKNVLYTISSIKHVDESRFLVVPGNPMLTAGEGGGGSGFFPWSGVFPWSSKVVEGSCDGW